MLLQNMLLTHFTWGNYIEAHIRTNDKSISCMYILPSSMYTYWKCFILTYNMKNLFFVTKPLAWHPSIFWLQFQFLYPFMKAYCRITKIFNPIMEYINRFILHLNRKLIKIKSICSISAWFRACNAALLTVYFDKTNNIGSCFRAWELELHISSIPSN